MVGRTPAVQYSGWWWAQAWKERSALQRSGSALAVEAILTAMHHRVPRCASKKTLAAVSKIAAGAGAGAVAFVVAFASKCKGRLCLSSRVAIALLTIAFGFQVARKPTEYT